MSFFGQIRWNCFSIVSCLWLFSSRRIWIFFANPDRTPQKIKKFQIVLCSLKLVLIFQLNIQDICQIQHNFKTLQEANKFIENYEIETKVCVILDVWVFVTCFFPKSWNQSRKEIYNYRRNVLRYFFIATEKKTHHKVFVNSTTI